VPAIGARMVSQAAEGAPSSLSPTLQHPRYSQSLERGLGILARYGSGRTLIGIAELADELGMSRSTTHRYVTMLAALGYLEQGESRKYRQTLRVTNLGLSAMTATGLREQAQDFMGELRDHTGYAVSLALLDGQDILYVARARDIRSRPSGKERSEFAVGSRQPGYCTAIGKLLLAHLPDRVLQGFLSEMRPVKRAPGTIASKRAMREELRRVREEGFAASSEEFAPGVLEVATPVHRQSMEFVAGLSIAAHVSMISLDELVGHLLPHLIVTADRISARLGYRRPHELGSSVRGRLDTSSWMLLNQIYGGLVCRQTDGLERRGECRVKM
jgi:IclR family transcriptional regulator, pca regulon regulatory protein